MAAGKLNKESNVVMGEVTKIQWCDHTFNPWVGCSKVAPGCANCYAEADMDKRRHFAQWGLNGTRVKTSSANWQKPLSWNREAKAAGVRSRVFCSSLADVFEDWQRGVVNSRGQLLMKNPDGVMAKLDHLREDLFELIDNTPWLDWLLLTKRPENIRQMWPSADVFDSDSPHKAWWRNVWLGTSISDQTTADKAIPELLKCRDLAPVLFLSVEPLLGPVNLARFFAHSIHCMKCHPGGADCKCSQIDWVIVGGESGPNARPCRPEWIRSIVQQCKAAGVPIFVKQFGANVVTRNDMVEDTFSTCETGWPELRVEHDINGFRESYQGADCRIVLRDKKGGDPAEWPEDLRVREFPQV